MAREVSGWRRDRDQPCNGTFDGGGAWVETPSLTGLSGHRSVLHVARSAERRKAGGSGEHHFWVTRSGFGSGPLYSCVNSLVRDAGRWLRRSGRGRISFFSETVFFGITGFAGCGGLVGLIGLPGGRFVFWFFGGGGSFLLNSKECLKP